MTAELTSISDMQKAEAAIATLPPVDFPLTHRFFPGIYLREILIKKGSILSSLKHKTEHPFIVLDGEIAVLKEAPYGFEIEGHFTAGHIGRTIPGTKRLLYAITDCRWLTCHATDLKDPDEIVQSITEPFDNPLIAPDNDRLEQWRGDGFSRAIDPTIKEIPEL